MNAGAELVLSVNSSNRSAASDWGCEVVVVPDDPRTLAGLDETIEELAAAGVRLRIDPVLEPIGFGFAGSLGRYLQVRERYPDAEMMMGIGNLTELTDADSAAINTLLLGFCQEVGIHSVLTTQVINWARSSVRECDLARRLVYHSVRHRVLPKHLEPRLVMLRDPAVLEPSASELERLSREIKDANYRVFVSAWRSARGQSRVAFARCRPVRPVRTVAAAPGPAVDFPRTSMPPTLFILDTKCARRPPRSLSGKQYEQDEPIELGARYPARATSLSPRATRRPRRRRDTMKPIAEFQNGLPLVERLDPQLDALQVFQQLADLPHVVFFDSAMRHPKLGRYSFVAADPVEWLAVPADGSDALGDIGRAIVAVPDEIAGPACRRFRAAGPACSDMSWACSLEAIPRAADRRIQTPCAGRGTLRRRRSHSITSSEEAWLISQGLPETDLVGATRAGSCSTGAVSRAAFTAVIRS